MPAAPPEVRTQEDLARNIRQSSIVLGYDKLSYQSEKASRDEQVAGAESKRVSVHNAEQKKSLQKTNFTFGAFETDYNTSSAQEDPTGALQKYTGMAPKEYKDRLARSTVCLGYEKPKLSSTAGSSFVRHELDLKLRRSNKEEVNRVKKALSRTNYSLGETALDYSSESGSTFKFDRSKLISNEMSADMAIDLRASHFNFGKEPTEYGTSNFMDPPPEDAREGMEYYSRNSGTVNRNSLTNFSLEHC